MKLILDYATWRCGDDGDFKLGEGYTSLLNKQGYSCCLGQFIPQLLKDVTSTQLLHKGTPEDLKLPMPLLVVPGTLSSKFKDSKLTLAAVSVNDNPATTVQEKITALKELFLPHEIEVINQPNAT